MAIKKSELYSSLWKSCDELRGGMDASQYKDYVLVLLFVKYVSDKYAHLPNAIIRIPMGEELGKGGSFQDMVYWMGKKEIGDEINKIIARLAEANGLTGIFKSADFNGALALVVNEQRALLRLLGLVPTHVNQGLNNVIEGIDLIVVHDEVAKLNFLFEQQYFLIKINLRSGVHRDKFTQKPARGRSYQPRTGSIRFVKFR